MGGIGLIYSWFHENGFFSVHSFNEYDLSIPDYIGSWGNRFQETHSILCDDIPILIYKHNLRILYTV